MTLTCNIFGWTECKTSLAQYLLRRVFDKSKSVVLFSDMEHIRHEYDHIVSRDKVYDKYSIDSIDSLEQDTNDCVVVEDWFMASHYEDLMASINTWKCRSVVITDYPASSLKNARPFDYVFLFGQRSNDSRKMAYNIVKHCSFASFDAFCHVLDGVTAKGGSFGMSFGSHACMVIDNVTTDASQAVTWFSCDSRDALSYTLYDHCHDDFDDDEVEFSVADVLRRR